MRELLVQSAYFGAVISIGAYMLGTLLHRRLKIALVNPLLIAVALVIAVLLALDIDYESYYSGAKYISYLLTPATVCLAVPLYKQLGLLKKHFRALALGIAAGVLSSLGSILLLSYLFGLTHVQYVTLLPKSVTTAIGIGISESLGGVPQITVAMIILTGITGNMLSAAALRRFGVTDPAAAGLAIGASSHVLGTAKALEMGEVQGAMSSLSTVVSGLLTVVLASVFAMLY